MPDDFDLVERERGVLNERDRRFLLGELDDELSDNQKYQRRYQIRQRIRNSMYDFWFLNRALSNRDAGMLWAETDDWIFRSRRQRRRDEAPPYPEKPLLAECWRDLIAFFVHSQIKTEIPEGERLVEWVIEKGVNKAVRRHFFENIQMYQEVDSTLDWGVGDRYRLQKYLQHIGQRLPENPKQAEEYLLNLQRKGYLQHNHTTYLYHTYIENQN
jgi:hypothetical protein